MTDKTKVDGTFIDAASRGRGNFQASQGSHVHQYPADSRPPLGNNFFQRLVSTLGWPILPLGGGQFCPSVCAN